MLPLRDGLGAVLLQGAKAVGKTATAQRLAARTVRLDRPAVAEVVRADPASAVRPPYPVFFDEWQHVPELLDELRIRIDDDPTPGLALLAGSAAPAAGARPTHSGAGRIVVRRMRPLTLAERLSADALSGAAGGKALSRLGESPSLHLVDPALTCHLLGVDEDALMDGTRSSLLDAARPVRDGSLFGALFESLVVQSMRTYAEVSEVGHYHLRTHGGDHEIDGLLLRRDHRCVAYEVKLSGTVNDDDVRHLRWLREQLGDRVLDCLVITTGNEAYRRRSDGIAVVPAAMLAP
ncbi:MAG: ATP-binding protein [Gemmatimonadaceae bacterium]|jgi:predicted AAA+ superfamily ATPase|nr:ATP-binding protein [Gemmatimonadaceae bacterium]